MEHSNEPKNSKFAALCFFVTGTTPFFSIGYFATELGPIIPVLNTIYNETYTSRYGEPLPENIWLALLTLTISMVVIGGFFGGIITKFFLSILSRKHVLQLFQVTHIIGVMIVALVGGLTGSYEAILVGRFIGGLPVGVFYIVVPMLMAEMSARGKRAMWQSCALVSLPVGMMCGPVAAHPKLLGNYDRWPILVAIGAIPSMIYLICSICFPESPYYYIREKKQEQAMKVLRKLRTGSDDELKREMFDIEKEVNATTTIVGIKEMLTTKQYRNQLIAVFALYAGLMLTGVNNFLFYADLVFLQAGISQENVTFCTIGVFVLQCIASIFGTFFIKLFGGLKVHIASTTLMITALTIFTISQATRHLAPTIMPIIAIISAALFFVSYFGGVNLTTVVLATDITIEPTRTTAFGYGSTVLWITSWFVGFIPPYLRIGMGAYSMTIWLGCTIFYLVFQLVFLPDTKGKTQDEIQNHFK